MARLTKKFQFEIPIKTKRAFVGNIEIDAVATLYFNEEPDIDYNSIKWNGCNILELLENFLPADEIMQKINEAAHKYVVDNFSAQALIEQRGIELLEAKRQEVSHV